MRVGRGDESIAVADLGFRLRRRLLFFQFVSFFLPLSLPRDQSRASEQDEMSSNNTTYNTSFDQTRSAMFVSLFAFTGFPLRAHLDRF